MTRERYYKTMRAARAALSLDTGFDPFINGGWGRPTKRKLADAGYIVDRKRAEEIAQEPHCAVCQIPLEPRWNGSEYEHPTHCSAHRRYTYQCDNGHAWQATEEEDGAADHRCPKCGGYWA